jgi:hypothetical protein
MTDGTKLVAVQRMDLDMAKRGRAKALAIADNRAGQISLEWDPEVLTALAGEMDMTQFFTAEEFANLTGAPVGNELVGDEDDAPELAQEPTTRDGDLYVMGSHRFVCGDATKEGTYQRLMDVTKRT